MTGCGCFILVATLAALLTLFLRGSTDTGEPFEQAAALLLVAVVACVAVRARMARYRGRRSTGELARPRTPARQAVRAIAGTKSMSSARSSAAPTRSTVASS